MATRPPLSPETKAAIEKSRRDIFRTAAVQYDLLFFSIASLLDGPLMSNVLGAKNVPTQRMTETLKLQLRNYFYELFDAEAKHYAKLAFTEDDLRSWLDDLSSRTIKEVATVAEDQRQNYHCHPNDRSRAIQEASAERVEHWMKLKPTAIKMLPAPSGTAPVIAVSPQKLIEPVAATAINAIGPRLDEIVLNDNALSHEGLAAKIGISRTTYFQVKAGRGGKKARKKIENYLASLLSEDDPSKNRTNRY